MPGNTEQSTKNFSEVIADELKDQEIEVYFDEEIGEISYSDYSIRQKAITRGIVRGAVSECLMLEFSKVYDGKKRTTTVYLNDWFIKGVVPVKDGIDIADVFGFTQEQILLPKKR